MPRPTTSSPSQRMLRVAEQVRHALSETLQRGEIIDPLIENTVVSVSEVRMSPDLKVATAFVSPLGAKDTDAVVEALNKHAKFVRGRVSGALRQMKFMPEFRFKLDTSFDNFARINDLLKSPEVARDLGPEDQRQRRQQGHRIVARRGKKKGRPISGWLVLDKPVGMGSTEAVSKIKWLFQAEKAGHAGTLDPLASGMLPIALGEATKTVPYVQDGAKIYRFTVAWGQERSTDDLEGPVTKSSDLRPSEAEVRALLPKYTGVIMQTPPQFSAIKIAGERAYDLARDGETVDIPAREIEIGRLDIIEHNADHTVFEVECGKGTYVRSLARDMGRDLGCFGHIAELRRVEVEPFTPEDFVTIAELEAARFGTPGEDNSDGDGGRRRSGSADRLRRHRCASGRYGSGPRLPAADRHQRRCGDEDPPRQSGHHPRSRRAGGSRGSLRHGARQAGRHRRHRARHVQAQAGLCRLMTLI